MRRLVKFHAKALKSVPMEKIRTDPIIAGLLPIRSPIYPNDIPPIAVIAREAE
jgi:hypothetical protein